MKIYFKDALFQDEFKYLMDNFEWVEFIAWWDEYMTVYNEVMFDTWEIKEWFWAEVLEYFLKDWYKFYWDRLDMKYYLE